jgi:copper transport protein
MAGISVCALSLLGWAAPASAHAELSSSSPTDGSVVDASPSAIVLRFTEGIVFEDDGIRLLDGSGTAVPLDAVQVQGSVAEASIDADLARGTYVVAWRAVSADGHPIRGAFTFSVGQRTSVDSGLAEGAFGSTDDRVLEVLGAVARLFAYVGTLGGCGAVLIGSLLRRADEPTPVGRSVTWALAMALVGLAVQLVALAALATGEGIGSIREPGVLSLVLDEGFGITALFALISLLGVTITSGLPFEGAARRIALVGAATAPVSLVLYGHTRTMSPAWLGYGSDAIHLLAGTVWFGGLLATIAVVRRRRTHADLTGAAEAVATFSGVAALATALILASGLAMSWIEVGGIGPLTSTSYGRLLLAKVLAVGVVLICAAWNRFLLIPRVSPMENDARGVPKLERVMTLEAALIVVVLAITSVLVNVTPAKAIADPEPLVTETTFADGTVTITVEPARVGTNRIELRFDAGDGSPTARFDAVGAQLELPAEGIGPIDLDPVEVAGGRFEISDAPIAIAGTWSITITAKADQFTEVQAAVELPIE